MRWFVGQDFNLRLPLVDGHGNFGSLDDGPAAARYTEARMSQAAVAMTADLTEDTVDFEPNYDNQMQQPSVLPAAFSEPVSQWCGRYCSWYAQYGTPQPSEVIAAARHLLKYPEADTKALMKLCPARICPQEHAS